LAIIAKAKKTAEINKYFNHDLFSVPPSFCEIKLFKKINHQSIAKQDNANTHISVLLSTNTKKAHIQDNNHINNKLHHIKNETGAD
jgi:hypothetical protein